jgi:RNA polymerase sigma-70 factor (ECF subfamily)
MTDHASDPLVSDSSHFAATRWSVVLAAGHDDSALALAALETLCRAYWYPLYAYVRRRGYGEHDAQDLTQGFFAHLLQREAFGAVAPGRGRFRSFLLASLNHFLADQHDRQQAQKRGGGQPDFSLDALEAERRYQIEPVDEETPDKLFERRWAIAVIDGAMARLEQEFASAGKGRWFEQLRGFLVEGPEGRSYAEVAARLDMSEDAVRKAAQRLRHSFRRAVREELAQTVATPADIEEELRHLWNALSS